MNRFNNWMNTNNLNYKKIQVDNKNQLQTTKNINRNEIIIQIPEYLIITVEKIRGVLPQYYFIKNITLLFCVFLLEEGLKREESLWYDYINIIFKKSHSYLFHTKYTNLIEGTLTKHKISTEKNMLEEEYIKISKINNNFNTNFSLEQFIKTYLCVCSIKLEILYYNRPTMVIIPLLDMINHNNTKSNVVCEFDSNDGIFYVRGSKNIRKNKMLYRDYNISSNIQSVMDYGFVDTAYCKTGFFDMRFEVGIDFKGDDKCSINEMFMFVRNFVRNIIDKELNLVKNIYTEVKKRKLDFQHSMEEYNDLVRTETHYKKKICYQICLEELRILTQYEYFCNYILPIFRDKKYNILFNKKNKVKSCGNNLIDGYLQYLFSDN